MRSASVVAASSSRCCCCPVRTVWNPSLTTRFTTRPDHEQDAQDGETQDEPEPPGERRAEARRVAHARPAWRPGDSPSAGSSRSATGRPRRRAACGAGSRRGRRRRDRTTSSGRRVTASSSWSRLRTAPGRRASAMSRPALAGREPARRSGSSARPSSREREATARRDRARGAHRRGRGARHRPRSMPPLAARLRRRIAATRAVSSCGL